MNTHHSRVLLLGWRETWKQSLQLFSENLALFLGGYAVVAVPEALLAILAYHRSSSPATFLFLAALGAVCNVFITGALTRVAAAAYLREPMNVTQAYTSIGIGGFVTLFLASIMSFVGVGIGCVLLIIPGIYLMIAFMFTSQVIILEGAGPWEALWDSMNLVEGSWWRLFGITLTFQVPMMALQIVAQSMGTRSWYIAINPVGILFEPLYVAAVTLLYFNLREQSEPIASATRPPEIEGSAQTA